MIRIFIRQLFKHKGALLALGVVWLAGGYYFFSQDHDTLRALLSGDRSPRSVWILDKHWIYRKISHFLVDFPEPGEENPAKAYSDYVRPALERLNYSGSGISCYIPIPGGSCDSSLAVRLDLMEKACNRLPPVMEESPDIYRPHWLELMQNWNPSPGGQPGSGRSRFPVDPDDYWHTHISEVLKSLSELTSALNFAYRIPPNIADPDGLDKEEILIPELIEQVSKAACRPQLGQLAWGDYVNFLEERLLISLEKEREYDPGDAWIFFFLERPADLESYILALRKYRAGVVPDPFSRNVCDGGKMMLPCHSPAEALETTYKLLQFTDSPRRESYYLDAAQILLSEYLKTGSLEKRELSLHYLSGSTASFSTEREARLLKTRLFIYEKEYMSALQELVALELLVESRGKEDPVFSNLTHAVLQGLGFYREADCYSKNQDSVLGSPAYCEGLRLSTFLQEKAP